MKKRITLFIFLMICMVNSIVAQEASSTSTYTLSRETFNAAGQPANQTLAFHQWNFKSNNCTLSLINGIGGTNAGHPAYTDARMLFLKDVQFQLVGIPSDETITSISFVGNGVNGATYLTELDGTTVSVSNYAKSLDASNTPQTITQNYATPIGRNFTFTFSEANAQLTQIIIQTKKLTVLTSNNRSWDFTQGFASEDNDFVFGTTMLKGFTYDGSKYDSKKGSEGTDFRGFYIPATSDTDTDHELSATSGIQVNSRSQIFSNAIGILAGNSLKFHVEKGEQIVFNMRTHTTNHTKVDGNSVSYTIKEGILPEGEAQATNTVIDEWGNPTKGHALTSTAGDYKLIALVSGDFILTNQTNTTL